jgi:lipopolysaccharide export system ATP-binding protein
MTDDEASPAVLTADSDHGVSEHKAHVREEAAAGNGLAVISIAKSYDKRTVLSDVSLSVGKGEVVGLLGPNGAGKTTCFYSIMGLVKPDAGRIMLDGADITALPMYRRAILGLGYLPQETSIFRGMTVAQNIGAVLELSEPDKVSRERRLEELLDEFGLTRLRDSAAMALSGGARPPPRNARPRASAFGRRGRCGAANAAAPRLRARSPRTRRSCCSTSPLRASTPCRSAISATLSPI